MESYFVGDIPKLKLAKEVYGEPEKDGAKGTWKCGVYPSQEGQDAILEALRTTASTTKPARGSRSLSRPMSRNLNCLSS